MRLGGKLKKQNRPVKSSQNHVSVEEQTEFVSLQEAANYCKIYSQEYLSLRARQGKVRAIKLGRNWVTTKQWVDEYLREVNDYNNNRANGYSNGHSNGHTLQENEKLADDQSQKKGILRSAQNDTRGAGILRSAQNDAGDSQEKAKWQPNFQPVFTTFRGVFTLPHLKTIAVAMALVFGLAGVSFGYQYFQPKIAQVAQKTEALLSQATIELAQEGFEAPQNVLAFAHQVKAKAQYANQALLSFSYISTKGAFYSIKQSGQLIKRISFKASDLVLFSGETLQGFIAEPSKQVRGFFKTMAQGAEGIALSFQEAMGNIAKKAVYYVEQTPQVPKYLKNSFVFTKDFFVGSFQILKYNVEQETIKEEKERAQKEQEKDFQLLTEKIKNTLAETGEKTNFLTEGASGISNEVVGQGSVGWQKFSGFIGGFFDVAQDIANNIKDNVVEGARFVLSPWLKTEKSQEQMVNSPTETQLAETGSMEISIPQRPGLSDSAETGSMEIIKQVFVTDNVKLALLEENNAKLQNQITNWQGDINNLKELLSKLQARPPQTPSYVQTSPVYISSPGVEVTGNAVLTTLNVSGTAGIA
ncbi:hypothetical protein L6252_00190, partial [Candidatus Parcubacteria bacterium]|nr:hypothetical protein [Candidatus Parcubacteria bacterium]